ncbi:MAG: hypothetical protein P8175_14365 [Deltaproteobacteria bacterium]
MEPALRAAGIPQPGCGRRTRGFFRDAVKGLTKDAIPLTEISDPKGLVREMTYERDLPGPRGI